jgi:mitogen-activated protein kinase 15
MHFKSVAQFVPQAEPSALNLIEICFQFNPERRPSSVDLLSHPFVAEFHNEQEETIYPYGPLRLHIDDNTKLTAAQYRDTLYQEITDRRREVRAATSGK